MNPIPNNQIPNNQISNNPVPGNSNPVPVDSTSPQVFSPDSRLPGEPAPAGVAKDAASCPVQRQGRIGSVIDAGGASSLRAANDAGPAQGAAGQCDVVHYRHLCHTRRFDAWLHGSQVLDVPLPACYEDSPEHHAEALASQRRAVREDSYLPGRTPLLLL